MDTRQFLGSKYAPAFGLELFELRPLTRLVFIRRRHVRLQVLDAAL